MTTNWIILNKISPAMILDFSLQLSLIFCRGTRPIHFSFDIDSMDPSIAASTGTPGIYFLYSVSFLQFP